MTIKNNSTNNKIVIEFKGNNDTKEKINKNIKPKRNRLKSAVIFALIKINVEKGVVCVKEAF